MSKRGCAPGRIWASKPGGAWVSTGGCASEEGADPAAGGDDEGGGGGGGNMAQSIQLPGSGAVSLGSPNLGVGSGAENQRVGVTKPLAGSAMPPTRKRTQRASGNRPYASLPLRGSANHGPTRHRPAPEKLSAFATDRGLPWR